MLSRTISLVLVALSSAACHAEVPSSKQQTASVPATQAQNTEPAKRDSSQPAATAPVPAPPEAQPALPDNAANLAPQVRDLLDRIEKSGTELTAFTANITYEKEDAVLGRKEVRTGEIIYRVEPEKDGKRPKSFAVLFDALIVGNRRNNARKHYIFNGRWLAEVDHENKQFIKRELVPPGKELDPLKLGEGPIPLPIGQPRSEVLARFEVAPLEVPKEGRLKDLQNVDGLLLTPKPGVPEARDYSRVELFYDRGTNLPVGINAIEISGNRKTVLLRDVQRNPALDAATAAKLNIEEPDPNQWHIDVQAWQGE